MKELPSRMAEKFGREGIQFTFICHLEARAIEIKNGG
jgi:hypothetical protein